MAIRVQGTVVVDNDRNANAGVVTATSMNVPPSPLTFSPVDGASGVSNTLSTITLTYSVPVQKGSGNITLRDGSATGSVIETIAVSSGSVTISTATVDISPSAMPNGKNIFVVIDAGAFSRTSNTFLGENSLLLDTYNFSTGPVSATAFSPADGATSVAVDSNIVITFSDNIAKGSGNITLRAGSASGTVRQTIDVTSGAVSVSGTQATINPPSDLQYEEDTYVVVDAGCFTNTDGDAASANAIINTYNFTAASNIPPLGGSGLGGYLICCSGGNLWITAPISTEVSRYWTQRSDAVTCANANASCGDWFVPTISQLQNPGWVCRTYWDSISGTQYWSSTENGSHACFMFSGSAYGGGHKLNTYCVRAFRCASY